MNENELIAVREYEVVKHNDLIQKSRFQLTLAEQKILQYVISMIKPSDTALHTYKINISEFCKVCGIHHGSGKNYKDLKDNIQKLASKNAWIEMPDGSEMLLQWVGSCRIYDRSGILTIRLHEDVMPYLIQLKKNYTQYTLKYVLTMQSKYSVRLYEILRSYMNIKKPIVFELEKLKWKIDAKNYKLYANFKNKVLSIAMREINEFTDIKVSYEPIKEGRKVSAIKFVVEQKTDQSERLDTWCKIENKLESNLKKS